MTLYDDLLAAGVPLASHGSDLYAKVTDDSRLMIEGYEFRDQVQIFKNAEDGAPWYDIPFAFSPFWKEQKCQECGGKMPAGFSITPLCDSCLSLPDVGTKSAPGSPRCCYVGGLLGLHALECPQHRPDTCPTCLGENQL